MNVPNTVAKIRLAYHLNMLDVNNVLNQLHLMRDDKADMNNKNHLKKCIECYTRLGVRFPEEFIAFQKEGS